MGNKICSQEELENLPESREINNLLDKSLKRYEFYELSKSQSSKKFKYY